MKPRTRESLVWGLLGGLTVLVVGLASKLGGPGDFAVTTVILVAVVVTVVTTALAYRLAPSIS